MGTEVLLLNDDIKKKISNCIFKTFLLNFINKNLFLDENSIDIVV